MFHINKHIFGISSCLHSAVETQEDLDHKIIKECTIEHLCSKNIKGETALMTAVRLEKNLIISKILNSEKCKDSVLNILNNENENFLMIASRVSPSSAKLIINSSKCTIDLLKQVNNLGFNSLMLASLHQPSVVEDILNSSKFKEYMLIQKDEKGNNALMIAFKYNISSIKPIINSEKCTPNVMKQVDIKGLNYLMLALDVNMEIFSWLLDLNKCNKELITSRNTSNLNVLMYASKNRQYALKTLIMSEKITSDIIKEVNEDGETFLHILSKNDPSFIIDICELVKIKLSGVMVILDKKGKKFTDYLPSQYESMLPYLTNELKYTKDEINYIFKTQDNLNISKHTYSMALIAACENFPDLIQDILNSNKLESCMLQIVDSNGHNALEVASRWNPQIVKLILLSGKCTNNLLKHTCFHFDEIESDENITFLDLLRKYGPEFIDEVFELDIIKNSFNNFQKNHEP